MPEAGVRRRYSMGLRHLLNLYRPLADGWWLYDGSSSPPSLVAWSLNGQLQVVREEPFLRIAGNCEG